MIPGQQSIPQPSGPSPAPRCAWCQDPADSKVVLQKGRVGTHKGRAKPVMEKSVPACGKCARRLAANNEGLEIG